MRALGPLGMTIYIYAYSYTFMAFQSTVRLIYTDYLLKVKVDPILASKITSSDYMYVYISCIFTFRVVCSLRKKTY